MFRQKRRAPFFCYGAPRPKGAVLIFKFYVFSKFQKKSNWVFNLFQNFKYCVFQKKKKKMG